MASHHTDILMIGGGIMSVTLASLINRLDSSRSNTWQSNPGSLARKAPMPGTLEFGTEVLATADRSMAALLGASPGASTCVSAILNLIERCLPELVTDRHPEALGLTPTPSQMSPERSISA